MTASCMTCIYSQLTKEQYPCSECYYDNNGNPSKHEPVVEAPDINVGNIRFADKDHVWINNEQYISITRVGQMLKEARRDPGAIF